MTGIEGQNGVGSQVSVGVTGQTSPSLQASAMPPSQLVFAPVSSRCHEFGGQSVDLES